MYADRDGLDKLLGKGNFYFCAQYTINSYHILKDIYDLKTGLYLSEHNVIRKGLQMPWEFRHDCDQDNLYCVGLGKAYIYYNAGIVKRGLKVEDYIMFIGKCANVEYYKVASYNKNCSINTPYYKSSIDQMIPIMKDMLHKYYGLTN